MAAAPAFASTVLLGAARLGAVETSTSVPTTSSVIVTAGASGSKIEEIVAEASTTTLTPTTVAGLVYLYLYDGATYWMFDTLTVTAVTASATTAPFRASNRYANLWLATGWSLRASQSVAANANLLVVSAFGGSF